MKKKGGVGGRRSGTKKRKGVKKKVRGEGKEKERKFLSEAAERRQKRRLWG